MAKELPFFKFEPNQWENGNIQICSREDKGLFIDTCSMYWSRLGDLPIKLAIQKLCAGNATAYDSLCEEKIIEVVDGNIYIKFLSEQLNEFEDVSKQNSKNAKDGWEKRRKQRYECDRNATASNPQSETYAIREEKIIEDKRIQETSTSEFVFFTSLIELGADKKLLTEWLKIRKKKKLVDSETAFKGFVRELNKSGRDINEVLTKCVEKSWGGFESEWYNNNNNKFNSNGKQNITSHPEFQSIIKAIDSDGVRR